MSRKILTTFLEQNPWSEVAEKDETTRKEVQIVSSSSRDAQQAALMADPNTLTPSGTDL